MSKKEKAEEYFEELIVPWVEEIANNYDKKISDRYLELIDTNEDE